MTEAVSRWIAIAVLAALMAIVLQAGVPAGVVGAAPLAALIAAAVASQARWAIATAIVMLPYFCYGVMLIVTDPGRRLRAIVFAGMTIVAFFAALDSMRRR